MYLDSKILQLLSEYIKELLCVDLCEKDMNISKDDIKAIFSIKNMIDTKISFVPSCSDMAKITGMSMSKFKKCFTQIVGMPFYTYVIDQRLEQAAKLIATRKFSISQVAMEVGYSNMGHFSVAFKKKYGISPRNYA